MLSLPEVPWRRVAVEALGADTYRVDVLEIERDDQFSEVVDVISDCLGSAGRILESSVEGRSVVVTTTDFTTFLKNLVFEGVAVAE